MEKAILRLLEQAPFDIRLIIKDAGGSQFLLSKNPDDVFQSASLIKVPILLALLDSIENRNFTLHQTVQISKENRVEYSVLTELGTEECSLHDLLVWMIITSDNTATNVLIDLIGLENINRYFKKVGLTQTKIQRKMMDFHQMARGFDNVTTAADMATLYTAIYRKSLLSKEHSELVIDILSRQRVHESLRRYLVEDVKMAHKTGSLATVEHDVGIVFSSKRDYIIGVFVTDHTNSEEAKRFIGQVSKIVYDHLAKEDGRLDESSYKVNDR
ncbi:serine hydrolase [Ureibacillus sinduriensis]|uniref:Beta-lactamase n=1 Tax=Ureibacillus sinduriensis BLB-1 = JCM 15800 TaxID=1384057 RepID=A0A0A3HVR8_9BACL|nr:serine hydrolase [Ureibacillus sinduriensis]KGR74403.1 beta-lactamase [Ureibacillus sinduriensis BLB-1 = JCM 15800]